MFVLKTHECNTVLETRCSRKALQVQKTTGGNNQKGNNSTVLWSLGQHNLSHLALMSLYDHHKSNRIMLKR